MVLTSSPDEYRATLATGWQLPCTAVVELRPVTPGPPPTTCSKGGSERPGRPGRRSPTGTGASTPAAAIAGGMTGPSAGTPLPRLRGSAATYPAPSPSSDAASGPEVVGGAWSAYQSSRAGSSTERGSRTAAMSCPCRIRFTGISSFLPVLVCGMPGAVRIVSGTCRGEAYSRMAATIRARSSSSSSIPGARVTKSGIQYPPPGSSAPMTSDSSTSGTRSTAW